MLIRSSKARARATIAPLRLVIDRTQGHVVGRVQREIQQQRSHKIRDSPTKRPKNQSHKAGQKSASHPV